jgi:hypothetical protein
LAAVVQVLPHTIKDLAGLIQYLVLLPLQVAEAVHLVTVQHLLFLAVAYQAVQVAAAVVSLATVEE